MTSSNDYYIGHMRPEDQKVSVMEQIQNQKDVARKVYRILRFMDPEVILAGGAPRNWHLDRPAKDLDFFLRLPENPHGHIETLVKEFGAEFTEKSSEFYRIPQIAYVFERVISGVTVQLVVLEKGTKPVAIIDTFDFDLCKTEYNFESCEITMWTQCKHDHERKTITLNVSKLHQTQLLRVPKRCIMLQELFPDYNLRLV